MTTIEKFKKDHWELIFKPAHTIKEATHIVALCVGYVLSFYYGVVYTARPDRFADCLEQDFKSLKGIMEMVAIPNICPHCGLMSDWVMMPMQTIVDAAWMIAITKAATDNDPCGYVPSSLEDIEAAITAGCSIYIEFFCTDCCYEENAYIRAEKIEPIPMGSIDWPQ